MISGWAMLIVFLELLAFSGGVTIIIYTLNLLFPPFKKIVDILVNADKY